MFFSLIILSILSFGHRFINLEYSLHHFRKSIKSHIFQLIKFQIKLELSLVQNAPYAFIDMFIKLWSLNFTYFAIFLISNVLRNSKHSKITYMWSKLTCLNKLDLFDNILMRRRLAQLMFLSKRVYSIKMHIWNKLFLDW